MADSNAQTASFTPFIPASQSLPEITIKAVILSIILVLILGAANTYLGLKVGQTVSAAIPAAVISMAVLRLFRRSNILENNIVQTSASAGEALAGGTIYTVPALLIMHYWTGFNYWQNFAVCLIGGTLGVLFSVPVRRIMVNDPALPFPEGTATANVLKASTRASTGIKELVFGGLGGGFIALCQTGFQVVSDGFQSWFIVGKYLVGWGFGFDSALFAAGYIIGISVAISALIGILIGWIIGVPVITFFYGIPALGTTNANVLASALWSDNIRYMGIGTMLVGAIWCVVTLLKPMYHGIATAVRNVRQARPQIEDTVPRTERDINIILVGRITLMMLIPLAALLFYFSYYHAPSFPFYQHLVLVLIGVVVVGVFGFILSSVCGYFAGLIGSSVSPISGIALMALLASSILIVILMSLFPHLGIFAHHPSHTLAAAIVIVITALACCSASISNETIQDLKAGQLVGATPWKQQVMMFIGVIVASFAIPGVLTILFNAYGIGGVYPHAGMDPTNTLLAPQASMMAAVAEGVFAHNFHAVMLSVGAAIAVVFLILDHFLKKRGLRVSVLAMGSGIYLPIEVYVPVIVGGFVSYFVYRTLEKRRQRSSEAPETIRQQQKQAKQRGLLLACGMVAGSALMGVILAIPFTLKGSSDALKLVSDSFTPYADFLGFVSIGLMSYWIYKTVCGKKTAV